MAKLLVKINKRHVGSTWDDYKRQHMSKEERAELDLRVSLIISLIGERKKANLTQKQLEKLTGVRQPTIAKIENGSMNPSVEVVMKLLAAMGKTLKIASL